MNKIKLGDVLDFKRGMSVAGEFYSNEGRYVRLTLGNFTYPECGFKLNTSKDDLYYNGTIRKEFIMKKGDIITPLTEQVRGLLGNTATIPVDDLYIQTQDVAKLIPNEDFLDKRFAYYLVSSPVVKKQLDACSQQTKIRHTSPDKLKDCYAYLPKLDIQKKIAKLMDSFGAKIENNNKIISELESMAKTLYDYWFLQFEFPNEEGKPYKSSGGKMVYNKELKREIPEGWENTSVDEMIEKAPSLKSIKAPDYLNAGKYPIVDQADSLITGYTNDESFLYENKGGCVVFGDVTTYFKYINFPFAKGTDGTKIMIAKNNRIPPLLLFHILRHAKLPNIGFARHYMLLRDYKFAAPSKTVCDEYDQFTKPMMDKRASLIKENQELVSLRDFLLPMLMNGQVTFKED